MPLNISIKSLTPDRSWRKNFRVRVVPTGEVFGESARQTTNCSTGENVDLVSDLVLSQEGAPLTHQSVLEELVTKR